MTDRKTHLDTLAVCILLACCLFWGFQQVLVKATLPQVPPLLQAAIRFVGATLVLLAWCRWKGIALFERNAASPGVVADTSGKVSWAARAGLLAGLLFAAEFLALYLALSKGAAARVTLFLYAAPFWVALLLPAVVKSERMKSLQWLGLVIAFLGLCVALRDSLAGGSSLVADILAVLAGLFWGLTTVVIRASGMGRWSAEKVLFYQVAMSAALLPLGSLALGESWSIAGFGALAWWSLAIQTLIGAFASYLAWMWLLTRYPATRLGAFTFLTPVFALIIGAWWLGEAVTPALLIALAMVACGIVLVNRS